MPGPLKAHYKKFRDFFLSIKLTIICLSLLAILVVACTLAQVRLGTFAAVDVYIRSLFVYWAPGEGAFKIPVFPGGGLVGFVLMIHLIAVQLLRLRWDWLKIGIWVTHLGLALFFVGEFVTGFLQQESQMIFEEGQSRNYVEDFRSSELIIAERTRSDYDEVVAIPADALARRSVFAHEHLPFTVKVKRFYPNSMLRRAEPGWPSDTGVVKGEGASLMAVGRPKVSADNEADQPSANIEIVAMTAWSASGWFPRSSPHRKSSSGRAGSSRF
ncbi:MAG: hypothetical protein AABZ44_05220 [Elusimicrobiota bacterium]